MNEHQHLQLQWRDHFHIAVKPQRENEAEYLIQTWKEKFFYAKKGTTLILNKQNIWQPHAICHTNFVMSFA